MTEQVYSLEDSLKGNNTVYIPCEFRQCRQNYAICLNIHKAYKEGRRKPDDYCTTEIAKGICPALKMRQEEIEAGHALYYIPRKEVVVPERPKTYIVPVSVKDSPGYKRGYDAAGDTLTGKTPVKQRTVQPIQPPKPKKLEAMDMAGVVSQMAKEHSEKTVENVKSVVTLSEPKVESMLEKARRIREEAQREK
jgi:hypothetical protein